MIKCKWREEGKEEYNRKGPRCIRESKRGIKIFLIFKKFEENQQKFDQRFIKAERLQRPWIKHMFKYFGNR